MKLTSTTERARDPAAPGLVARRAALWADQMLLTLLVAFAALLPRAFGLADFLTTDEAYHWITRTERFMAAVAEGRWADTILTGHPGVTLMWLGGLGLRLEQLAIGLGWIAPPERIEHLAWLRLGPALAHAVALAAGYLLLRRLVRPGVALSAALLWATSPFLVAHGRLLHLDALLTNLVTLTVLATLVASSASRPLPWLILAGLLCGLALLTKGPALIVLPAVGLIMFALGQRGRDGIAITSRPLAWIWAGLRWSVPHYLLLLCVAALTVFLLWPALWADPDRAVARYVGEIVGNGGRPNGDGQFFLGSTAPDPGPLFYPLAGLYRLTPVELIGLALLAPLLWRWARVCSLDPAARREQGTLLVLGAFALFWVAVMTVGPKKFDRYILPMWPALLTLSAAGLVAGWSALAERLRRPVALRPALPVALLLAAQGGLLGWYHPYYLSYYSPMLGGGPAAQRMFLIGWGEGMDQVGAWLRARPDIGHGQILSALPPTLQPFVPVPVREVRMIDQASANYAVVYLESVQRGDVPEIYGRIATTTPLHTVRIHGIEYARIHQLARPFARPVGAEFGGALGLLGFTAVQEGATLVVSPAWDTRATPPVDLMLFLHLFDANGTRVARIDVPPGGASVAPTGQWRPGEQVSVPLPIDLPADLPAGEYTLALGLYDPATGARLPLSAGAAADPALAGPDAALLGAVELTPP